MAKNRRLVHVNGGLRWETWEGEKAVEGPVFATVEPEAAGKICAEFNGLDVLWLSGGRDFFITLPDPARMKGAEHQEGSHEYAEARVHSVGQIALPRGRKQIHAREVL